MSDTEPTETAPADAEPSVEEQARKTIVRRVAQAIWKLDSDAGRGEPGPERKAAWQAEKKKYLGNARKLIRRLEQDGVSLRIEAEET